MNQDKIRFNRRRFLATAVSTGAGFTMAMSLPAGVWAGAAGGRDHRFNAFLTIDNYGAITFFCPSSEMGQGSLTSCAMVLAEELDVDWTKVRSVHAPLDRAYVNPFAGVQATAGSSSINAFWDILRRAGATARHMLVSAAAQKWKVSPAACVAGNSRIRHPATGRVLTYGELAGMAAGQPPPEDVRLKSLKDYRIIGASKKRLDIPAKVNGSAVFGADVSHPDLLTATVAVSPAFGGKLKSFNRKAALAQKGVTHVVDIPGGIAVVADSYWRAKKGLDAGRPVFSAPATPVDTTTIRKQMIRGLTKKAGRALDLGDTDGAMKKARRVVKARYEVPFLAHGTMSPQNATVLVKDGRIRIQAPTQAPEISALTASAVTGIPVDKIQVETTFLGGGFGRRFEQDVVAQAALISKRTGRRIKVLWSREEDIRHDFYRPCAVADFEVGLDEKGWPVAWSNRLVSPCIASRAAPMIINDGWDAWSVDGANNIPYKIPNQKISYRIENTPVPVGFWRSVGSSINGFFVEAMIDELAVAAGKDAYRYRRHLLRHDPRFLRVLDLAAEKAGWDKPPPSGRYRGLAIHKCAPSTSDEIGGVVCHIVEITCPAPENIRVEKVVCAVDCGLPVNPDNITAQMEGGLIFGLTATLRGNITLEEGAVTQSNFHDYPMVKMAEVPEIETHIVPSRGHPGGVGEPGVPPIAPALISAVHAATGRRLRSLPLSDHGLAGGLSH